MSETKHHELIILGSGPAGFTAAIYAARANLKPVVIQGMQPGGQLTITTEVDNFPGFEEGVQGPELMQKFQAQAERFNTEIVFDMVTEADLQNRPFTLKCDSGDTYTCDALIVSTGASARWLGMESEQKLNGFGVSACATCDGFFFKGQDVCVVGGGDTAVEEALYLSNICNKVYLIHRRDELRAEKIMQKQMFAKENIIPVWDSVVDEIEGDPNKGGVTGVRVKNVKTDELKVIESTGCFIAIGHSPNTGLFGDQLTKDDNGYLITNPDSTSTNVEGVFAAGDVQDSVFRQAVTAAGTGCMAAIEAERWLAAQKDA
uniref:Thioredoxin reductase n=1 Tax=Magnetococcus massalia (strain MO-1) TaxID=451514 RepID=A0A1S7LQ83_MAGMO|nr:Thioredoxin reductase, FAD/NAD(P)-binding [Candidatus Magnetococcus massalia]